MDVMRKKDPKDGVSWCTFENTASRGPQSVNLETHWMPDNVLEKQIVHTPCANPLGKRVLQIAILFLILFLLAFIASLSAPPQPRNNDTYAEGYKQGRLR